MYDLMCTRVRVPECTRYTDEEFQLYTEGYDWALVMAMRVLFAAEERCELHARYERGIARRRRQR